MANDIRWFSSRPPCRVCGRPADKLLICNFDDFPVCAGVCRDEMRSQLSTWWVQVYAEPWIKGR